MSPWEDGGARLVLAVRLSQDDLEAERREDVALALVELGLELDPVKSARDEGFSAAASTGAPQYGNWN